MMDVGNNQAAYRSENGHHPCLLWESYLFMYYSYEVVQPLDVSCCICGCSQPAA